jgi:predicted MPP superfamily phosphohydrolase
MISGNKMKKIPQFVSAAVLLKKNKVFLLVASGIIVLLFLSGGFISRILAIYFLPIFYVHFRLKKLFLRDIPRKAFTFFYILLIAAFPVTELLSHAVGLAAAKYLLIISYDSLPFLLYFFLLLVFFDVLSALNRLLKIIANETIKSRKFQWAACGIIFFLAAAIVIAGSINYHNIQVNEYRIEIQKKSSALNRLRIVLAADLHLGNMTHKQFMKNFADKINSLNPDIVLLPGDLLEGNRDDADKTDFERQFRRIKAKFGVYASPGNHESHGSESNSDFFSRAHIHMLADSLAVIDQSFSLAGRKFSRREKRKSLPELLRGAPENLPLILLDHLPAKFELVSCSPVDIQLSGHTHYGQLFPFQFITELRYPLSWGYKKIGRTHFFVTCGVQGWGPRVRTAGVSEIMLIVVEFVVSAAENIPHGS